MSLKSYLLLSLVFSCFLLFSFVAANETQRDLPGIDIVRRGERGADETWRLSTATGYRPILDAQKKQEAYMKDLQETDFDKWQTLKTQQYEAAKKNGTINSYLNVFWSDDFAMDKIIDKIGKIDLRRPVQYRYKKTAIIIHHTADEMPTETAGDEFAQMQKIYKFHTFTRGRGDIGYNFIIGPSGRIYEGRAGGPGTVGAHAKYNNVFAVGISLMGNFENQQLPPAQRAALVQLTTALVRKYDLNPFSQATYHKASSTFPYIADYTTFTIAGHKDAGVTACPGKNVYDQLAAIRKEVANALKLPIQPTIEQSPSLSFFDGISVDKRQVFAQKLKENYSRNNNIHLATKTMEKTAQAPLLLDVKKISGLHVRVLLYDLSTKAKERKISCPDCVVTIQTTTNDSLTQHVQQIFPEAIVGTGQESVVLLGTKDVIRLKKIGKGLFLFSGKTFVGFDRIRIMAPADQVITVPSYKRKSYAGIPWNTFRGSIIIEKTKIPSLKGILSEQYGLINELSLDDYLAGIVETNDAEPLEKNKLMSLLAKNYMLFYIDKTNIHPNIPADAPYNAIDDPRFFQKYAGAGVEKTIKSRAIARKATANTVLAYSDKLAFIPYFSCSAGFTWSASEKRGRTDTSYLQSKMDIGMCPNGEFDGHGVGISGKGATIMTSKGMSYLDVVQYYVPGVEAVNVN